MNGILIINKEKNYTSRDIVNIIGKILGTKKIGHTGTLDPIATGVLVLCIGSSLKLVELLTNHDKEYITTLKLGIETERELENILSDITSLGSESRTAVMARMNDDFEKWKKIEREGEIPNGTR